MGWMTDFDYIIVGAGLTGIVLAERISTQLEHKVLLLEQRPHIGGNCYDHTDHHGILIHEYGPHTIHTYNKQIYDYLSQYSKLKQFHTKIYAKIDDNKLIHLPFNLDSLHELLPEKALGLEERLIQRYGYNSKISILDLLDCEDVELQLLATQIYEQIYKGYNEKQWGLKPEEIGHQVVDRLPIHINRNNFYFDDIYQFIPEHGYTAMFKEMLKHKDITVKCNTNADNHLKIIDKVIYYNDQPFDGTIIYTGMIDQLLKQEYGELPYRAVQFKHLTYNNTHEYMQEYPVITHPNQHQYTRTTEHKQITGQKHDYTTITREYPHPYDGRYTPCYPIPLTENHQRYIQYKQVVDEIPNLYMAGRLGTYKYLNMDTAIEEALQLFKVIQGEHTQ